MLFVVTGASGAGKSTCRAMLEQSLDREIFVCDEFDSVGVPSDADTCWRQRSTEGWIQTAKRMEAEATHTVLCGQVAMGELLAAPSAPSLDGMTACLLDCTATTRRQRLMERGTPQTMIPDHINFGSWMRNHARDPQYKQNIIVGDHSWSEMCWQRWTSWPQNHPQWNFSIIDTDDMTPAETAAQLTRWIELTLTQRAAA